MRSLLWLELLQLLPKYTNDSLTILKEKTTLNGV